MKRRGDHTAVPAFYLRSFRREQSGPGGDTEIHQHDRVSCRWTVERPKDLLKRDRYFGRFDKGMQKIESRAARLLQPDGFVAHRRRPSADERLELSRFVALTFSRSPTFHQALGREVIAWIRSTADKRLERYRRDRQFMKVDLEELELRTGLSFAGMTSDDFDVADLELRMEGEAVVAAAMTSVEVLSPVLANASWKFFYVTDDDLFITSDQPILRGRGTRNYRWIMPLSPSVAIALDLEQGDQRSWFVEAPRNVVTAINLELWRHAPRFRFTARREFTGRETVLHFDPTAAG